MHGHTFFPRSVPVEPVRPSGWGSVLVLPGPSHLGETWCWWPPDEISDQGCVGVSGGGGPSIASGRPVSKVTIPAPPPGTVLVYPVALSLAEVAHFR